MSASEHPGPLRWAVIGYGDFGRRHARALSTCGEHVVAIVDTDPERRAAACADAPGSLVTPSVGAALAVGADVVVVATPEAFHVEPVLAALEHSHVLVEKPIAATAADARSMIAAASDRGRSLFVGHLLRFDPRLVALRGLIDAGALGEVVHVTASRHGTRSSAALYQRLRPFVLSGVHDADLACWFVGADPTFAVATCTSPLSLASPDLEVAIIEFGGTASAVIEVGRLLPDGAFVRPRTFLEVVGTLGTARIVDDGPLVLVDDDGTSNIADGEDTASPEALLAAQARHVAACVHAGVESDRIGPHSALVALEVMLAAAASATDGGAKVGIR